MNRRDFLKQSASALGALATISMLEMGNTQEDK